MAAPRDSESLGDLFGRLSTQLGTLIRQEMELARAELTASAQRTARNASLVGIGAAIGYAAFLALVGAAIALLDAIGLDTWVAALVVAIVLGIVAFALVQRGRSQLNAASLAPRRTIESLKDDAELAKERVR